MRTLKLYIQLYINNNEVSQDKNKYFHFILYSFKICKVKTRQMLNNLKL